MSLDALAATELDLLVIGAGIHGAFAAWDAVRRGWRVGLVDRGDFGGATSANSLKVVHGGFRYLQHGDVARLRASSAARGALLQLAPHLVEPLPCVMPTYGRTTRGRLALGAALGAYEILSLGTRGERAGARRIPRGRLLDADEYARLAAPLALPSARGGALWYDALLKSPDRLIIAVVRSAVREGAVVANYVEATQLLRAADGARERVIGARMRDEQGREVDVRARLTLVAASEGARSLAGAAVLPPFARACNVVMDRTPPAAAVAIPVSTARRLLFAVPWRGRLMLGTSQHEEAVTNAPEHAMDELLGAVNRALPGLELRTDEVSLVHEGLLPGTADRLLDRPILVDHEAREDVAGVVTMIGVKWTTSQRTAARAVALCAQRLGARGTPVPARLVGAPGGGEDGQPPVAPDVPGAHLWSLYGTECHDVATVASESAEFAAPLAPNVATIGAEIAWTARTEQVRHLADVVLRRTALGSAGHPGEAALAAAAQIVGRVLGWDAARTSTEIALVERLYPWRRCG